MIRFLAPFALLLSTACIQLGGEAQPTRYYLLAPLATTAVIENAAEVQLEMDALEFPSYLDRAQLVSRTPQGTIQIAEYDRWAEPLADNLSRTLQENLYQLAPGVQVNSALWNNGPPAKLLLRLRVNRFDGTLGHEPDQQGDVVGAVGPMDHQAYTLVAGQPEERGGGQPPGGPTHHGRRTTGAQGPPIGPD